MTVAVVTSVYGMHRAFLPRWWEAIQNLDPAPDQIIVASDRHHPGYRVDQIVKRECPWAHPQAFYLDTAVRVVDTDWVWVLDVDDLPKLDSLQGLEEIDADVWQLGYYRSDGEVHIPKHTTAGAYLAADTNDFAGSSMFRVDAYHAAGGYPDVAFQDWGLWRRLMLAGASFAFSTRIHFSYMLHDKSRTVLELSRDRRDLNVAEMKATEHAYA